MGANEFAKLPHIGESLKRKEDVRFLTGVGNYTDDVDQANQKYAVLRALAARTCARQGRGHGRGRQDARRGRHLQRQGH